MDMDNNKNVADSISILQPHSSSFILKQSTGVPLVHDCYEVSNYGRTQVVCELWYGTELGLIGIISGAVVKPGETDVIHDHGNLYYVTVLKVTNDTEITAYFSARYSNKVSEANAVGPEKALALHKNMKSFIKELLSECVKMIPEILQGISALLEIIEIFWPAKKKSVWEEIKDHVAQLIDAATLKMVDGLLSGELSACKERIIQLMKDIKAKEGGSASHYMNIAEDFIGFEHKFIMGENSPEYRRTNCFLLPLYSSFVHLKLCFYLTGITQQQKIGLSDDQVDKIKSYAENALQGDNGAYRYIRDMYRERVEDAYNTSNPYDIYDTMMNVRSLIGVFGLEYIPIWSKMLREPFAKDRPYVDVISYSTHFGRQNATLNSQATAEELVEPLTPQIVKGKRNKLVAIEVFIWRFDEVPKVGGVRLFFENSRSYTMGYTTGESRRIDFNQARLERLRVFGGETIDGLEFFLSDGRDVVVGSKTSGRSEMFELKDHHVVSMFLSTEGQDADGRVVNIAVAYQMDEDVKPADAVILNIPRDTKGNFESKLGAAVKTNYEKYFAGDGGFFKNIPEKKLVFSVFLLVMLFVYFYIYTPFSLFWNCYNHPDHHC